VSVVYGESIYTVCELMPVSHPIIFFSLDASRGGLMKVCRTGSLDYEKVVPPQLFSS
jgi:hypothetical protein